MGRISAEQLAADTKNGVRIPTWQLKYEFGQVQAAIKDALVVVGKPKFMQKFPTTACELTVVYDGRIYTELVVVRRYSKDTWNPETGKEIALGKARANIARRIAKALRKERLSNGN